MEKIKCKIWRFFNSLQSDTQRDFCVYGSEDTILRYAYSRAVLLLAANIPDTWSLCRPAIFDAHDPGLFIGVEYVRSLRSDDIPF